MKMKKKFKSFLEFALRILNKWIDEIKGYLAEFYASSSFGIRATIIVVYLLIVIAILICKYFIVIPQTVGLGIWLVVLALIFLFSHFLSTWQKIAMTASWLLFFSVLVGSSPLALIFTYVYLKFQFSMYVKGPYVPSKSKPKKPTEEEPKEDKKPDDGSDKKEQEK